IGAEQRLAVKSHPMRVFDAAWARSASKAPNFEPSGTHWSAETIDPGNVVIIRRQSGTDRAAVVPRTITRPRAVIRSDRIRATLLTPLTVASDALVLPVFGVFMICGPP